MAGALKTYRRSLVLMKKVGSIYGQAALHNNMGIVLHFRGELDEALKEYNEILAITRTIGDRYGTALSLSNIGNAYEDKGELDRALKIFQEAMAIEKEIKDRNGEATSLSNIGNVMGEMGRYSDSIDYNSRSLNIMREIADLRGISQSLKNLAASYLQAEMLDEAMESADEALQISREIGVKSVEGGACWIKGAIYREKGEWAESFDWFRESMETLEGGVDRTGMAKGLYEYALLFMATGNKEKTTATLGRALSMFESMGMKLWVEKCRKALEEIL